MADERLPWEIHQALTLERLKITAAILWRVAQDVALRMQPDRGDGAWGAGTSRFERAVFEFSNAAKDEYAEWLSTEMSDGHFLVRVGGVPVRFYRGAEDVPTPPRYAKVWPSEKQALQYALSLDENTVPLLLRFEIQVDSNQMPAAVLLVQVDEAGEKYNPFTIPVDRKAVARSIARKRAAVVLPTPKVGPKPKIDDAEVAPPIIKEENA